jgi:hypothetical protein
MAPFAKEAGDGSYNFEEDNGRNRLTAWIRQSEDNQITGDIRGRVNSTFGTWVAAAEFNMTQLRVATSVSLLSILWTRAEVSKVSIYKVSRAGLLVAW